MDEAPGHKPDLPVLFCREWNRQLDVIRRDPNCIPVNLQEARLYQGVYEALKLAQIAGREMGGIRVQNLSDGVLPPVGKVKRPSVKVDLAAVSGYLTAVVAVTKLENAFKFSPYFNALKKIAAPPVAGSLLIHHRRDIPMGDRARQAIIDEQKAGRLRIFPLEDNLPTFAVLECLMQMLEMANSKMLQLCDLTLSMDDCRDLVLKTHVIDNLDLFKALAGWHAPKVAAQAAAHAPGKTGGLEAAVAAARVVAGDGSAAAATVTLKATSVTGVEVGSAKATAVSAIKPAGTGKTDPPGGLGQKPLSGGSMSGWAEERLAELVKKLRLWNLPVDPEGVEVGPAFARLKVRPAGDKAGYKKVADKAVDLRIHLRLKVEPIIGAQAGYISVDVQLPERRVVPLEAALAQPPEADPTVAGLPRRPGRRREDALDEPGRSLGLPPPGGRDDGQRQERIPPRDGRLARRPPLLRAGPVRPDRPEAGHVQPPG